MRAKTLLRISCQAHSKGWLRFLPYTQKSENAEASLAKIFPAVASVKRYNKPDITVDGGRASFLYLLRMSRLRFAVPARIAHPRWRVSQARLRWAADYDIPNAIQEYPAVNLLYPV